MHGWQKLVLFTCDVVLFGTHPVAVLDTTAEVQHNQHSENYHHTLKKQSHLKPLPEPAGVKITDTSHKQFGHFK